MEIPVAVNARTYALAQLSDRAWTVEGFRALPGCGWGGDRWRKVSFGAVLRRDCDVAGHVARSGPCGHRSAFPFIGSGGVLFIVVLDERDS